MNTFLTLRTCLLPRFQVCLYIGQCEWKLNTDDMPAAACHDLRINFPNPAQNFVTARIIVDIIKDERFA